MSATTTAPDLATVRAAVEAVPDPELPPVTLGMLGMVHDVRVHDDGRVEVELLPTFSGCPATDMMERDVVSAVGAVPGVATVAVRFRFDPPWRATMITDVGRERLREFGIAPPGGEVASVAPAGRATLPLVMRDPEVATKPCPYCGSADTVRESSFGPTPCRDIRFCNALPTALRGVQGPLTPADGRTRRRAKRVLRAQRGGAATTLGQPPLREGDGVTWSAPCREPAPTRGSVTRPLPQERT